MPGLEANWFRSNCPLESPPSWPLRLRAAVTGPPPSSSQASELPLLQESVRGLMEAGIGAYFALVSGGSLVVEFPTFAPRAGFLHDVEDPQSDP